MKKSEHAPLEQTILSGGFEQLIAKPPLNICDWPLHKVVCFKDAVCAANTAYERANNRQNRRDVLIFLSRARSVIEFYQEDSNHAD